MAMWFVEELDADMSEYFKIIEEEAKELRARIDPQSAHSGDDKDDAQEGKQTENQLQISVEGFKSSNYNLYLADHDKSERQTIRHINLTIHNHSEMMEYATQILECSNLDTPIMVIHEHESLAESFAIHLCNQGFWSVPIVDKTTAITAAHLDNANKAFNLTQDSLTTFRCLTTTIKFLRDNCDFFKKRPCLVISFETIPLRIKYLERWLNYCAEREPPAPESKKEEVFVYHMRLPFLEDEM